MRYSLLNFLVCPFTQEKFLLMVFREVENAIPPIFINEAQRVNAPDTVMGTMPADEPASEFFSKIALLAGYPGDPARNFSHEVMEGLLVSVHSGNWYPIIDGLPEILPSSLRDWNRDYAFLGQYRAKLPAWLYDHMVACIPHGEISHVSGDNYKMAEMELISKVDDPQMFLGPGAVAPFYIGNYFHSIYLLRAFSTALHFLSINHHHVVIDSGCGYAWTTEWFQRLGIISIGLEINRIYADVGRRRMGSRQPHLIICDVENIPLCAGVADGVLGFDGFHHIPNRRRAMQQFWQCLRPGGRVVLIEPSKAHAESQGAIDAMQKYGTLEDGMDYADVVDYVQNLGFQQPVEYFLKEVPNNTQKVVYLKEELFDSSFIGWRVFQITKES